MVQKPNTTINPINASGTAVATSKLGLRDYIKTGTSLKVIADGEYPATISNMVLVENTEDPSKDYLRIEIMLPDRPIPAIENRFESGYFLFEREIKSQLGLQNETLPVLELLNQIIGKPIKVWYNTVLSEKDGKFYQNVSFAKPVAPKTTTAEVPKF